MIKSILAAAFILLFSISAEAKVDVYNMYGLGGPLFSAGMETNLATKLRKNKNYNVPRTTSWVLWQGIVEKINKTPRTTKVAINGHSMGCNAATWIQASVNRPVDFIGAYDCTIWSPVTPLGKNTKQALSFYSTNWTNIVGHAKLTTSSEFKGKLVQKPVNITHTLIDDANDLHEQTIRAMGAL